MLFVLTGRDGNTLVPVPLHAIDTPASSAYILQDSGASVLVTDKVSRWEKIKEAGFDLSALKKVIITDDEAPSGGMVSALATWLASASQNADLPDSSDRAGFSLHRVHLRDDRQTQRRQADSTKTLRAMFALRLLT